MITKIQNFGQLSQKLDCFDFHKYADHLSNKEMSKRLFPQGPIECSKSAYFRQVLKRFSN